ncbi:putative glyoxalase family protein [Candidatus Vecturithrix granuli]|uniref:Putative glyoxalase family protein n=1 Tax=Vecturithrix granuli TaxID=1499967 RepID=A0A081C9N3_VECG1|nr:putative glyoxalase family protein [Candidatus Vecturithrix granuli]
MQIEHVAIWTRDIERLKMFYVTYFGATAGKKYVNSEKEFESYFLTFDSGARLEIMQMPGILDVHGAGGDAQFYGYTHLAFSVGSPKKVDELTTQFQKDGCYIISGPRHTGDGYYESCVLDPDGNRIEITT